MISPFRVDVPQDDLDDLRERLARTRWPDQIPGSGWSYGTDLGYLGALVEYWQTEFDWRVQEARLNAFPQFTTVIDGQSVHFVHVRSASPGALPLILTHGWPSTVLDFLEIIEPLRADFHLVIPSLPGFPFSGPTTSAGWDVRRVARAWASLMELLGYDRYGAQGGDYGSLVSAELGRIAPAHVAGVHLNALVGAAAPLSAAERDRLSPSEAALADSFRSWWQARSGYATQMSTRPQTVAVGLNDSPAGQLAWNLEWFVDYDPTATRETVDRDAILANVTAYWLTGTAASAARLYRESLPSFTSRPQPSGVPTAVANFHGDRALRGLADLSHRITRWSVHPSGGHFAALQAPDLLVHDIRTFFGSLPDCQPGSGNPTDGGIPPASDRPIDS